MLFFVGVPVGFGVVLYFVFKKTGYPKKAKFVIFAYGLIVLTIGVFVVFEDQFFTKNDAKELVEEQGFKLTDEFELVKNESMFAIGDYYHTFTLKISEQDKQSAIRKIKGASNFKAGNVSVKDLFNPQQDRYFGKRITQNYETENSFVREYFQPSGRQGYAPTFRRIELSKTEKELIFEDIDE